MALEDPTWPTSYGVAITVGVSEVVKFNGPDSSGFDRDAEQRLVDTKFTSPYSLEELRYFHEIKQQFDEQGVVEFLNPDQEHSPSTLTDAAIVEGVESTWQVTPHVFKRLRDIEPAIGAAAAFSSSSDAEQRLVDTKFTSLYGLEELRYFHEIKKQFDEQGVVEFLNPDQEHSPSTLTDAAIVEGVESTWQVTPHVFKRLRDIEPAIGAAAASSSSSAAIVEGVESTWQVTPHVFKRLRDIEPAIGAAAASSSSSGTRAQVGDPLAELSGGHVLKRPRKDLVVSTEESVIENLNPATDSSSEAATGAVVSAEVGGGSSVE